MKRILHKITPLLDQVHTYPLLIFIGFLYAALSVFAACGAVMWFPHLLNEPQNATLVGGQLFEIGTGILCIGGITAPMMDLILHFDTES